jgi:DNA polymerase I-like protein with 3'-5' exonuclease and polymerase domains
MYGGSAYAYATDPDFASVNYSEKQWQKVIDAFYTKYYGLAAWHKAIVQEATQTGRLIMPTGRIYNFELKRNWRGELKTPETIIKNYPVQGLGADIMSIARVSFTKRFYKEKINGCIVNTIHDSIVCDVEDSEIHRSAILFHNVFRDIPRNFQRMFGVQWDLPLQCEVSVGKNMEETVDIAV